MADYKNVTLVTRSIYYPKGSPLDVKQRISKISDYKDIMDPWVGMEFYAELEGNWYQVDSLADGYLRYIDNAILPSAPSGVEWEDYEVIPNKFIGTYSERKAGVTLGESSDTAYRGDRGKTAYDHSQVVGNPHGTTKSDIGLGNVENKSSATIRSEITESDIPTLPISKIENLTSELESKIEEGDLKTVNGVSLVGTGNIVTSDLELGESSTTAYRGDRGKQAYDHSQITSGNPHNVTKVDIGLGNVENKSVAEIKDEIVEDLDYKFDQKENVIGEWVDKDYQELEKSHKYGIIWEAEEDVAEDRKSTR